MAILLKRSNRVDPERMNAFEEALYRLGQEYGFVIMSFHVTEDRASGGNQPEIDMTWLQLPRDE